MRVMRSREQETRLAPGTRFTGTVYHEALLPPQSPSGLKVSRVHFAPGARTFWHSHPAGQALHVVYGHGRVRVWGQPIVEIGPGDTVFIAPGEKHWHGAAPTSPMVHLAISAGEGDTDWMEPVSDEDYAESAAP